MGQFRRLARAYERLSHILARLHLLAFAMLHRFVHLMAHCL